MLSGGVGVQALGSSVWARARLLLDPQLPKVHSREAYEIIRLKTPPPLHPQGLLFLDRLSDGSTVSSQP